MKFRGDFIEKKEVKPDAYLYTIVINHFATAADAKEVDFSTFFYFFYFNIFCICIIFFYLFSKIISSFSTQLLYEIL